VWPRGLSRGSAADGLFAGSNTAGGHGCLSVANVLLGRGLCVGLITRPEESHRVWCVLSVNIKPR
jgi:hypothetical protein